MGDEPVVMSFRSPDYGIHALHVVEAGYRPARSGSDATTLGFNWVKQKFAWRDIEGIEKGQFDWYRSDYIVDQVEKAGLNLLVRLDRQPFWSEPAR
jgi:hypothetical protein